MYTPNASRVAYNDTVAPGHDQRECYMLGLSLMHRCNQCGNLEERTFTDSWTGKELCLTCLYPIIGKVSQAPQTESDNLEDLLND